MSEALLAAAETSQRPWSSVHLEWSQAGTQHSGRTYLLSPRTSRVARRWSASTSPTPPWPPSRSSA
ncbi:hypothetical protein C8046_14740 [Serinibacter arcticus]|uniref:Uncharacterized protein n=1 Tax=Serinibacter arcticus TaxID=1655435 RepID=A0A2U1ZXJ8_9MICO|nr:hypothetical protein C8046_14740 [Serinibacter arcticus]